MSSKKNASRNTRNTQNNSKPYFVIASVEGDIRRKGMSTDEICKKYGKTPDELKSLISRAYHGAEVKVRELMQNLEKNDEIYELLKASHNRREQPDTANQEEGETLLEIQQKRVNDAQRDLDQKTTEMTAAEEELKTATASKELAQKKLDEAKAEFTRADNALMMSKSKLQTATANFNESRARYDKEVQVLDEMTKPVLLHISAAKEGIPGGKVYMSTYDYDKLSIEDKKKVIPVDTKDSTIEFYPDGFYDYPIKLGMDGYQSACQYALAYVKLILEGVDDIELRCADENTKEFARIQNPEA